MKDRWLAKGDSFAVAGLAIPGGMLYVTERATQFGQAEPSLIDATLRVAHSPMSLTERQMPYWPSYRSITPEARRAYLQWLAGGRRQPADAGYVFLFFYGLERRALIDALSDPQAKAEIPAIKAEVKRLLALYGDNHSFCGYATRFLAHIDAGSVQPQSYMAPGSVAVIGHFSIASTWNEFVFELPCANTKHAPRHSIGLPAGRAPTSGW